MCDSGMLLCGEIRCWSLLGVKRLTATCDGLLILTRDVKILPVTLCYREKGELYYLVGHLAQV